MIREYQLKLFVLNECFSASKFDTYCYNLHCLALFKSKAYIFILVTEQFLSSTEHTQYYASVPLFHAYLYSQHSSPYWCR